MIAQKPTSFRTYLTLEELLNPAHPQERTVVHEEEEEDKDMGQVSSEGSFANTPADFEFTSRFPSFFDQTSPSDASSSSSTSTSTSTSPVFATSAIDTLVKAAADATQFIKSGLPLSKTPLEARPPPSFVRNLSSLAEIKPTSPGEGMGAVGMSFADKYSYPLRCSVAGCDQTFSHKSSLRRHLKRHLFPVDFSCPHCHKKFSQRGNLLRHLELHKKNANFR